MDFKIFVSFVFLASACSKGTLYFEDESYSEAKYPQVSEYSGQSPSIGMVGVYDPDQELYFGAGEGLYDLMYLQKSSDGDRESIERFIFKQTTPLNIVDIAVLPVQAFNPLKDAECFIKITGRMVARDQCDGGSICKQFQVDNIYSDTESDTCGWPSMRSFILKLDQSGAVGSVAEPGVDSWTKLEKINYDGVSGTSVKIASEDELYNSVVATSSAEGFVFAGKLAESGTIAAHFVDPGSSSGIFRSIKLGEANASLYSGRASTRNLLLVVTPDGFYKLSSEEKWEKLALPEGFPAMPLAGTDPKIQSANGIGTAAFRFTLGEGGADSEKIVLFKEATSTLVNVDMSTLGFSDGLLGWILAVVNDSVWLWNPVAPNLARRYLEADKKWEPVTLIIPPLDSPAESLPRYQLSSAGSGFVLTTTYEKDLLLPQWQDAQPGDAKGDQPITFRKKVFRHYFYNSSLEYTDSFLDSFNPPDAIHFNESLAIFERVVAVGTLGKEEVLDYGYVYNFSTKKGRIYNDSNDPNVDAMSNRLAKFSSIVMKDTQMLFFGGCVTPVNGICLSAPFEARLVDLAPKKLTL